MGPAGDRTAVVDYLVSRIEAVGSLSEDENLALFVAFGHSVTVALEAAFSRKYVIALTAQPSGRRALLYDMLGEKALCFVQPSMYCSCDAFAEQLVQGQAQAQEGRAEETPICKHLLAVRMAVAGKSCMQETCSDGEFAIRVLEGTKAAAEEQE